MELNLDILINFAPIFFTFIFIFVILLTVLYKLKIRWPVRANCWFCNYDASIWRHEADWWLCPSCSQYNGFTKDGDYKYFIPEQKEMPQSAKFYTSIHASNLTNYKNGLCFNCNDNEELKLFELRKFEELSSKRTEKELLQFRQIVEEKYPLCSRCKQVVNDVLHKQSLWLTRYKMLFFKQRPIKAIMNVEHNIEKIVRILLIIMDSLIIYNSQLWPLPIVGVILQLGICFVNSKTEKHQDILLTILWICISIVLPIDESKLFKTDIKNAWMSLEYITKYHFVTALGSIIGFMNIKSKSYKASAKTVVAFKKLDISSSSTSSLSSSSSILRSSVPVFSAFSPPEKVKKSHSSEKVFNCPVNVTDFLMENGSLETEIPIRSTQLIKNKPFYYNESCVPKVMQKMRFSNASNFDKKSSNQPESWSLNDSLHNLSALSLNEAHSEKLIKTSKVFETKVYNTSTSALFSKYNKTSKKSILAPPKLRSVTQASWVAGGYWQAGMEPPTLSRSSSQSSGFGSADSNLGPSREPSVYNDFDQSSIVSDVTQCCCFSRRNSQVSFNPDCRFNYLFLRPASPTCSQLSNLTQSPISVNNTLPLVHSQMNKSPVPDQYSKSSRSLVRHLQVPVYTGHTTVITSPVWLPVLLCGSLIFNMIVLCTILLR